MMKLFKTVCLLFLLLVGLSAMGQQVMLTEPVPQTNHLFGRLVALKKNFAAVMTDEYHADNAIYIYQPSGQGWKTAGETAKLTTSTGAILNALAADDGIVVAGSLQDTRNGVQTGSIYVWVEPRTGWVDMTETAILSPSDGKADACGAGVAVNGHGRFIVGGCPGWNNNRGKALIFVEPANGWVSGTERFQLTASDGQSPDFFGYSVSMQGPVIAAGALNKAVGNNSSAGAIYVFQSPHGGWQSMTQTAELTAAGIGSALGRAVSLTTNALVSLYQSGGAMTQTALWQEPASGWQDSSSPGAILTTLKNYAQFVPVIQGNRVVIGANAWHKEHGQKIDNGALFIYEKPLTGWTSMTESYELKVNAGKFVPVLGLGVSVALQGKEVLAGAPGTVLDKQQEAGAAFVFAVK